MGGILFICELREPRAGSTTRFAVVAADALPAPASGVRRKNKDAVRAPARLEPVRRLRSTAPAAPVQQWRHCDDTAAAAPGKSWRVEAPRGHSVYNFVDGLERYFGSPPQKALDDLR